MGVGKSVTIHARYKKFIGPFHTASQIIYFDAFFLLFSPRLLYLFLSKSIDYGIFSYFTTVPPFPKPPQTPANINMGFVEKKRELG